MGREKKADIGLVLMLLFSFILSLGLSLLISDHVIKYPKSSLMGAINFLGRIKSAGGGVLYFTDKVDFLKGLFFSHFLR